MSWFQAEPTPSLDLIRQIDLPPDPSIVDIGGGTSVLVDRLLETGIRRVSVLDASDAALAVSQQRLGPKSENVDWILADVLTWMPETPFDIWHDRAVFHFFIEPEEKSAYMRAVHAGTQPGSHVIIATFASDGPEQCSGLAVQRYDATELAAAFGADFETVNRRREEHRTPSGGVQPFTWLVLRRR